MYRALGENGGPMVDTFDPTFGAVFPPPDVVPNLPEPAVLVDPAPSGGGSSPAVSWNIGDSIARIISGITGGGSVRVQVPAQQGYPGSGGCPPSQCPSQAGPIVLCQPCVTPPPPTFQTSVGGITASPWFWPVLILGGLIVLTGRGRR